MSLQPKAVSRVATEGFHANHLWNRGRPCVLGRAALPAQECIKGARQVNSIRSAHGRPEQTFRHWVGDNRLIYIDQSKTPAWLQSGVRQFAQGGAQSRGFRRKLLTDADVVKPFTNGTGNYSQAAPTFYSAMLEAVSRNDKPQSSTTVEVNRPGFLGGRLV